MLQEAKRVAATEKTTLRELIEDGLRLSLDARKQDSSFRLRDASFKGNGLHAGVTPGTWEILP